MKDMLLSSVSIENLALGIAKEVTKQMILDGYVSAKPLTDNDELLTRKQAAKLLNVSLPTLSKWTRVGNVKGYRISRRIRYKKSELITGLKKM